MNMNILYLFGRDYIFSTMQFSPVMGCRIMREAKPYLVFIVLLVLAVGAADAAQQITKLPNPVMKPTVNPKLYAPIIHINLIKIAPAAAGNSEPISVSVNVTSRVTQEDICGLNASNFNIEGPASITNVYPISSVAINQPMSCDYWLSIVPNSPWVSGPKALKLDYMQGGQQISNTTFAFRI
jgi:hypothetical protein